MAFCLMLIFTFVIVHIGAKREATKGVDEDGYISTSTVMITSVKVEGDNNITYPSITGSGNKEIQDSFNNGAKKIVDDEIKSFNKLAGEFGNEGNKNTANNSLELDYQITGQNSNFISIKFIGYLYGGGAHGSNINISYNFDLRTGQEIKLADLFRPDSNYLNAISDYTINELKSRNLGDSKQIEEGASPKAENFKTVNISDTGLLFTFEDYQVAPYVVGQQTVIILFEKLKNTLNSKFFIVNWQIKI